MLGRDSPNRKNHRKSRYFSGHSFKLLPGHRAGLGKACGIEKIEKHKKTNH